MSLEPRDLREPQVFKVRLVKPDPRAIKDHLV